MQVALVEVTFTRECVSYMVTVCAPVEGYVYKHHGYSKGNLQKCEETYQETCYNKPQVNHLVNEEEKYFR